MKPKSITVFEHKTLRIGDGEEVQFEEKHWRALVKLNELHHGNYFEIKHNGIRFKQYVGVIQLDGLLIEVLPKIDQYSEGEIDWREQLINMLKTCKKLSTTTYGEAFVKKQPLNLLEIYFNLYLNEVDTIIQKGMIKQYRSKEGNVKALKGQLKFAKHLQQNLVHKERFYTSHQVYDTSHLLHHILYQALEVVAQFSKGTSLYHRSKKTALSFPEFGTLKITQTLLDKVQLNRKSKHYEKAFELARLILLNYSPDIRGGEEKMLALLFDMNMLWEEYIYISLKRALEPQGYSVKGQDSKLFWSSEQVGNKRIRPDIVVNGNNLEKAIILDTKWKVPCHNKPSDDDLKQMFVYNMLYDAQRSILVYPGNQDTILGTYAIADSSSSNCEMFYIDILDENKGVKSLCTFINRDITFTKAIH